MRNASGIVLVQALVMAMIITIIVTALLRMNLGRSVLSTKVRSGRQAQAVSEAAFHRAMSCLQTLQWVCQNPVVLPGNCAACGADCGQFFGTYDLTIPGDTRAYSVTVNVGGPPPNCKVAARCNSCL